jgi:leucyl aminopeptidase
MHLIKAHSACHWHGLYVGCCIVNFFKEIQPMTDMIFTPSSAFLTRKRGTHIAIAPVQAEGFKAWCGKQDDYVRVQIERSGFEGKPAQTLLVLGQDGAVKRVLVGVKAPLERFDFAHVVAAVQKDFSEAQLGKTSFYIADNHGLSSDELGYAHMGWGWACYAFDQCKAKTKSFPALQWSKGVDKAAVLSAVDSVNMLRNLVNMPANLLGPEELEKATKSLAKAHGAKVKVVKDQKVLEKDFPLVYTVGKASPRLPRLIEMSWGKAKDPKLTLVGKGVVFDTGGLDLKPSQYMRLMKKDMGGAAHVLALAKMVMDAELPVRLTVLIPAVENAVGGAAFRPGDVMKSRKGTSVENTNTDAEGRLVLADALAYACESKPDLIIDFATLTGSARAGLGPDIPAFFCNNEDVYQDVRDVSRKAEDPVWPMPLWQPYRKHIENSVGDLINSTGIPGDGIYSALFLESFVEDGTEWMHLDCFSWESTGRAGRPVGAADTGMRAMFEYVKGRYE